jgi:hypothetical protein
MECLGCDADLQARKAPVSTKAKEKDTHAPLAVLMVLLKSALKGSEWKKGFEAGCG